MTFPIITALAAACLMLLQMGTALAVVRLRKSLQISIGDGGHAHVGKAIRRHGNLAENAPLFLILFALLEMGGTLHWIMVLLAGGFVLGRVLHIVAFSRPGSGGNVRVAGMMLTFGPGIVSAVLLAILALGKLS